MTDQFISAEEAAEILGLQVRTVRNYLRDGRLPGIRIGKQYRIARADLDALTAGGFSREEARHDPLGPEPQTPPRAGAEVSSIVQVDGIGAAASDRLTRTLSAACLAGAEGSDGQLRCEPIRDEERQRLKLIIVGPPAEVADLLRIVDALTREFV